MTPEARIVELEQALEHEKARHRIGGDIFEAERNRLILNLQMEIQYLDRIEQLERLVK